MFTLIKENLPRGSINRAVLTYKKRLRERMKADRGH